MTDTNKVTDGQIPGTEEASGFRDQETKKVFDVVELLQDGWRQNRNDRLYDGARVPREFTNTADRLNAYWVTELNDPATRKARHGGYGERINNQAMSEQLFMINAKLSEAVLAANVEYLAAEPFSPAQEAGNKGFLCVEIKGKRYITPQVDDLQSLSEKSPERLAEIIQGRIAKGKMIEAPAFLDAFVKGVSNHATASDYSLSETIAFCRAWARHLEPHKESAPWAEEQLRGLYSLETTQPIHRLRQLEQAMQERLNGGGDPVVKALETAKRVREQLHSTSESSARHEEMPGEHAENGPPRERPLSAKIGEKVGALGLLLMFANKAIRAYDP